MLIGTVKFVLSILNSSRKQFHPSVTKGRTDNVSCRVAFATKKMERARKSCLKVGGLRCDGFQVVYLPWLTLSEYVFI